MKIKFLKSPKNYQAFALLLHEYWSFQKSPNLVTLFRSCLQIKILFDTFRNVTLFGFTSAKQLPINEAANAVRRPVCSTGHSVQGQTDYLCKGWRHLQAAQRDLFVRLPTRDPQVCVNYSGEVG